MKKRELKEFHSFSVEAKKMFMENEGIELKPYLCSAGKLTIGVGRNLEDKGISEHEADVLLLNDIAECFVDLLQIFSSFRKYSICRRLALLDMRFNLGPLGFRSFEKMIAAINCDNWEMAAQEAQASKWFSQVGKRAKKDIEYLREN